MARTGRARRRLTILGISAGVLAVGLGSGLAGVGWYRNRLVENAREKGFALYDEGKYAESLDPLGYYVQRRRSDFEGLLRLGIARSSVFLENNRHLVSAATFLETALKMKPGDAAALRALLPVYRQLGYQVELERVADALLAIDPRDARALEARLASSLDKGDWIAAARDAEALVEVEPDDVRWRGILLDVLRFAERPIDQRIALIDLWIAGGEPDGRYRLLRAEQFMLDGKIEEAKAQCELAADRGIAELASLERLVELMQLIGLEEDLNRTLERSRERFGAELIGRLEARLHFLGARHEAASDLLDMLWNSGQRNWEIGRLRVVAAEIAGETERSDRALAELLANEPEGSPQRPRILAWSEAVRASRWAVAPDSARRGTPAQRQQARQAIIRGLQANPDDPYLLMLHGEVNLASGEFDTARQLLEAAFQAESRRWALAGIRASHASLRAGATDTSFRIAREVVLRHPRNTLAYIGFAESLSALSREGRVASMIDPTLPRGLTASAILRQVYEAIDRDQSILVPFVVALVDEDRSEEALDVALEAAGREGRDVAIICSTVVPLLEAGEIEGVERLLRILRDAASDSFEVRVAAVDLLIARGELDQAAEQASAIVGGMTEGDARTEVALRQAARIASLRSDPQAAGWLSRYLSAASGEAEAASFVLGQAVTWNDEALVRQAIGHLRTAVGEDSQQVVLAEASRTLAFHRGEAKALADATVAVNQLLRTNPNSPPALIVLSRLLAASIPPDWSRASSFLARAVDLQPREGALYPELVVLLQKAGNTVDATRYLQQYLRLIGQDENATRQGARLLLNQGAFVEAIPTLERLSGQTGGEADFLAVAEANRAAGRVTAAEADYREAATRPGRSGVAVQAYAEFLARLGRVEEGRRVIREDAESPNPAVSPTDRAIFLLRLESIYGTEESTERMFAEVAAMSQSDPRVVAVLSQRALRRGDYAEALRIAEAGLASFPEDESLLAMTASLLIADESQRVRANSVFEQLGRSRPEYRDLLEALQFAGAQDGRVDLSDEKLAKFLQITEHHPLFPEGWTFAVSMHVDAGREEEAIRIARRAVSRLPSDPDIAALTARLLTRIGRFEDAKEAARAWRRLIPENTIEPDSLLASLTIGNSPSEAVMMLEPHRVMLESEPGRNSEALQTLVLAYLASGQRDKAAELALAHIEVGPVLAAWTRGARSADRAETKAMLDRIPIARLKPEVRLGIAAEYAALGARGDAEAVSTALRILEGIPDLARTPTGALMRADLLVAEGRTRDGVDAYEAVAKAIPPALIDSFESSPPGSLSPEVEEVRMHYLYALNNAAHAEVAADGDRDRGLRTIDRALRSGPALVFLLETKAQLLLAAGDVAGARNAATAATAADRNSLEAWLVLAEAELAAGRAEAVDRAIREMERISADAIVIERRATERRSSIESGLAKLRAERERA